MHLTLTLFLFCCSYIAVVNSTQCSVANNYRLDCFPQDGSNQAACEARGCCWSLPQLKSKRLLGVPIDVPYCYYPTDYPTYSINSVKTNNRGFSATLEKSKSNYIPNDLLKLNLNVIHETNNRVRIRITDAVKERFEVPIKLNSPDPNPPTNRNYEVIYPSSGSFSLEVKRKSDGLSLFKTVNPLLYGDQFIQLALQLSVSKGYGIGERNSDLLHNFTNGWKRMGLWARDNPIGDDINLYGTHSFFMGLPDSGKAFGLYFFNSNAQEFVSQPSSILTYRTTGGIIDLFIFTGDTPTATVQQYLELIGTPSLPPFWSLGFHLCRYGYKSVNQISDTLQRNLKLNIPIEVQWSDIDYMDKYKDFTYDPINYKGLGDFVKKVKSSGIKYVVIIDPAISNQYQKSYPAYIEGLSMNVFIRDSRTNKPLEGEVWPGKTVYPDFTHPNATKYWTKQIQRFISKIPVDGLWIDMNEPSNFQYGSTSGCPGNKYDNPFFTPVIRDNSLTSKTVCPSAWHYKNVPHYNLHNLYGYGEAVSTHAALSNLIPNKRPFVLSRSTFSGSGKYTNHWTGDNSASWDQLRNSIRQVLNFNMFGIPMVGADICGFLGNTNEELCTRWMQLGSFYPFMRNHNDINSKDQDPAMWSDQAQGSMRLAINLRYMLTPYTYTQHVKAHLKGNTVVRPMSFEFPYDMNTHSLEHQFMLGPGLMISPVVYQGATSVNTYFPRGVWHSLMSNNTVKNINKGKWINLSAPLYHPTNLVSIRGGHIIPVITPAMTTQRMRMQPFQLLCILNSTGAAVGDLYWDDGESDDSYKKNNYSYITFSAGNNRLQTSPVVKNYQNNNYFNSVLIYLWNNSKISNVTLNGKSIKFEIQNNVLILLNFKNDILKPMSIQWT